MIRILTGNYSVATEDVKQSIISNGFPFVVANVSSEEDLIAAWDNPKQKEASKMMKSRLKSIHDLLPQHKIGDDFYRIQRGKDEPLTMYDRNEIHHPTKGALIETETFQQDKRIDYAIMEVFLSDGWTDDDTGLE